MTSSNGIIRPPPNRAVHVANGDCPYCGVEFSDLVPHEKEHTVGRRFVPKGTLAGQWNLLLRSCRPCNNAKAALEDDISAITMHPDAAGRFVNDDVRLHEEAQRKAERSFSRRTKRPISAGEAPLKLDTTFGPAKLSFGFTMPPQVDQDRVFELAEYQVSGFFYYITFNEASAKGSRPPGQFFPISIVRKADWGNPQHMWFMAETREWLGRVHAVGADGYFKISLRRKAEGIDVWSWALEWNQNFRIIGFFGRPDLLDEIEGRLPVLKFSHVQTGPDSSARFRLDTPLPDTEDELFDIPVGLRDPAEAS